MYGNIDHNTELQVINYWFSEKELENKRISYDFVLGVVKLFLENNVFFFNDSYYRQLKGTAMGTKMAPVYAALVLCFLEKNLYFSITRNYSKDIALYFKSHYYHHLDDIFIIYEENKLSLTAITTF